MGFGYSSSVVYFIQNYDGGPIKIGFSSHFLRRKKALQTANGSPIVVIKVIKGSYKLESMLHDKFARFNVGGEWFANTPTVMQFIKGLPQDNLKSQTAFIESYDFNAAVDIKDTKVDQIEEFAKKLLSTLDLASIRARNSGFYEGVKYAQDVVKKEFKLLVFKDLELKERDDTPTPPTRSN